MLTKVKHGAWLAVVATLAGTSALHARLPTIRSVRVAPQGTAIAVVIEADGALPVPRVGVLGNPPRIYLDFPGVKTATSGTYPDPNAPVHGVRVAVNRPNPLVTRVVLDLAAPMPHRIDAALRERGQLTVVVEPAAATAANAEPASPSAAPPAAAAPPVAPASAAQPAQPPSQPSPAVAGSAGTVSTERPVAAEGADRAARPAGAPAAPRPPANGRSRDDVFSAFALDAARAATVKASPKDVEKYLGKAAIAIDRLERLRPILVSLDAATGVPDGQLKKAIDEFQSIGRALAAIEPPRKLEPTHELLSKACVLGAAGATARVNAAAEESARASTAATAAAGALMLLERARANLGFAPRSGS